MERDRKLIIIRPIDYGSYSTKPVEYDVFRKDYPQSVLDEENKYLKEKKHQEFNLTQAIKKSENENRRKI